MKKIRSILILIPFFLSLSSCEKDDICDPGTSTTPRLVIEFYDYANQATTRTVSNLKVTGIGGNPKGVVFNTANDDTKYLTSASKISIPLQNIASSSSADFSKFAFILNATSTTSIATDSIKFNYSHNDVYISRACGFKTLFNLKGTTDKSYILNNNPNPTSGNWIRKIDVIQPNVSNENETHVKIYF